MGCCSRWTFWITFFRVKVRMRVHSLKNHKPDCHARRLECHFAMPESWQWFNSRKKTGKKNCALHTLWTSAHFLHPEFDGTLSHARVACNTEGSSPPKWLFHNFWTADCFVFNQTQLFPVTGHMYAESSVMSQTIPGMIGSSTNVLLQHIFLCWLNVTCTVSV